VSGIGPVIQNKIKREACMAKSITGRTEDAVNPFLGADFWKKGVSVKGFVERTFQIPGQAGDCFTLALSEPVEIGDLSEEIVNIGGLKGFQMALQSTNYHLRKGDFVELECTGMEELTPEKKKKGHSPRINFKIAITPGNHSDEPPLADSQFA
jgi:hypothetical protein